VKRAASSSFSRRKSHGCWIEMERDIESREMERVREHFLSFFSLFFLPFFRLAKEKIMEVECQAVRVHTTRAGNFFNKKKYFNVILELLNI
jgi:hypothetical protein